MAAPLNAPPASRLVTFNQLSQTKAGDKVRFLCCVDSYDERTASLNVSQKHPDHAMSVLIDISHVLEDVNTDTLRVGAKINVIGYRSYHALPRGDRRSGSVMIQALVLWSADHVTTEVFNKAVVARNNAMSKMQEARAAFSALEGAAARQTLR